MKNDSIFIQDLAADPNYQYLQEIEDTYDPTSSSSSHSSVPNFQTPSLDPGIVQAVGIAIGVLAIGFLVARLLESTFFAPEHKYESTAMGSDTIVGHKWDEEIVRAMDSGDYTEVAVLAYLRRLEHLDKIRAIAFDVSKTPGMFLRELEATAANPPEPKPAADGQEPEIIDYEELLASTRTLTKYYLLTRYGHRSIDRARANELLDL